MYFLKPSYYAALFPIQQYKNLIDFSKKNVYIRVNWDIRQPDKILANEDKKHILLNFEVMAKFRLHVKTSHSLIEMSH